MNESMYFLLKIVIFQCHVSFQGCNVELDDELFADWFFCCVCVCVSDVKLFNGYI